MAQICCAEGIQTLHLDAALPLDRQAIGLRCRQGQRSAATDQEVVHHLGDAHDDIQIRVCVGHVLRQINRVGDRGRDVQTIGIGLGQIGVVGQVVNRHIACADQTFAVGLGG